MSLVVESRDFVWNSSISYNLARKVFHKKMQYTSIHVCQTWFLVMILHKKEGMCNVTCRYCFVFFFVRKNALGGLIRVNFGFYPCFAIFDINNPI
jgi:hypothetical protein